jgi:sporulation protein YlmC with PRC-barrel domain
MRMSNGLMKSGDLQGKRLVGRQDAKLGVLRELFFDPTSGQIVFVIVEGSSLLGGSGKFYPVPWSQVRYDAVADDFQIHMTKDAFKAAPSYDRDQLANPNFGWNEQSRRYFSAT